MRHISTTATAVKKVKASAREIQANAGTQLAAALEQAARAAGYSDYHHVTECAKETLGRTLPDALRGHLKPRPSWIEFLRMLDKSERAPVVHNPLKRDEFVNVTIEGVQFVGDLSSSGPYVVCKGGFGGDCALGVASISFVEPYGRKAVGPLPNGGVPPQYRPNWWVAKYQDQGHVDLSKLSEGGRRSLAFEFGLPIIGDWDHPDGLRYRGEEIGGFYNSKAFTALAAWAKKHPRKILSFGGNSYLGNWPKHAVDGFIDLPG